MGKVIVRKGKNANNELSKLCLVKLPVSNFELDWYTRLVNYSLTLVNIILVNIGRLNETVTNITIEVSLIALELRE